MIKFFIHLLGGYTKAEKKIAGIDGYKKGFEAGVKVSLSGVKKRMDDLYGFPADEWCKEMYEFVDSDPTIEIRIVKVDDHEKE